MKITIEHYGETITATTSDDTNGDRVVELFSRMLVVAGYPPSVIVGEDGGRYECDYVLGGKK